MFTIRRNVFETNSSSMHSVSYTPRKENAQLDLESLKEKYNGRKIVGYFGEYGLGYDVLCSLEEKLSYVLTMIRYHEHVIDDEDVNVLEAFKACKYFVWLSEMFNEYLGCNLDVELSTDDYYKMGYIDHQSTDTLNNYFKNDEEEFKMSIMQLLLDDNYTIIIDDDNH